MKRNFVITRTKRSVWFYSAVIFLLQTLAPTFQGVMAKSVNGYTDTLCTMYGPVTVFIKIEDDEPKDRSACYECSICIIQANLNAGPVYQGLQLETRYRLDADVSPGPLFQVPNLTLFPNFFSRAPPA